MRSSVTANFVAAGFVVAGLASIYGCSSDSEPGNPFTMLPTGGSSVGASGSPGASGSGGAPGASGSVGTSGASTAAGSGAGGATTAGSGAGGMSGAAAVGGMSGAGGGSGGVSGGADITKVVKTTGCGMDAAALAGTHMIATSGMKAAGCADSKCGPWSYMREYTVNLPANYDKNKAYPLVFQGPGCGGGSVNVYPLNDPYPSGPVNVGNTVIRVGLKPPPNDIGHATNPGQGCFDDKEGDDSVDWVFYETLYDYLEGKMCFDKNRVFSAGDSSGSWFSNELGCKYAGDAKRPVRGILPNTGGLPADPKYVPTCTKAPMAGIWVHEIMDPENPFTGNKDAIKRAMQVNHCTMGTDYDTATLENFPIGGGKPDNTCKKILGCPAEYPLVVCALPGKNHDSHVDTANPAFGTFLKMFSTGALISQ